MGKKKKVRVELRKNRSNPPRERQWTRGFQEHGFSEEATRGGERIRAKGDLSRGARSFRKRARPRRAISSPRTFLPSIPASACRAGWCASTTSTASSRRKTAGCSAAPSAGCCAPWLPTSATSSPPVIASGFVPRWPSPRPGPQSETSLPEGLIERVEPRHGILTRASRGRKHVLVANVDQVVFVMSLVEPDLKPHLVDRYLASAEMGGIAPIVCFNKADLVDPVRMQPMLGLYNQLGVPAILTSATTGMGVENLRERLRDRATVFTGQSGVGKSSLLNSLQPDLALRVREVSEVNQKGRHTTTTSELIRLDFGGWVVDTPGVRQFELWKIQREEVDGFFPEMRPFVHLCGFPDCSHTHEERCAVKRAVYRRQIDPSRYTSYLGLFAGEPT